MIATEGQMTPLHPHRIVETRNWLRYWRNSLADAESAKGLISERDLKSLYGVELGSFQLGRLGDAPIMNHSIPVNKGEGGTDGYSEDLLPPLGSTTADPSLHAANAMCNATLKALFKGEKKETQLVEVLARPVIYLSKVERGQRHSSTRPFAISPVTCKLWVSRNGFMYPADKPSIPRDLLSPQADDKLTLCSASDLDTYLSKHLCKVYTKEEALEYVVGESLPAEEKEARSHLVYTGWSDFYSFTRDMFSLIDFAAAGINLKEDYLTPLPRRAFIIKSDDAAGASKGILALYDWMTDNDDGSELLDNYAQGVVDEHEPCIDFTATISERLGHSSSLFPLAEAQRDALSHVLAMQDGDLLAVNGPPGTGKTTLVLSVVASLWVKAALEGSAPPLIIAASTNNQAVTNIIDAFGKDFYEDDSLVSGRWLPGISSYGGYFPAASKQDEAADEYQTKTFYQSLEQTEYLDTAEEEFLRKANLCFANMDLKDPSEVLGAISDAMEDCHDVLILVQRLHEERIEAERQCINMLGKLPIETVANGADFLKQLIRELGIMRADRETWRASAFQNEPVWQRLFKCIPSVAEKLSSDRQAFIQQHFDPVTVAALPDKFDIDAGLDFIIQNQIMNIAHSKGDQNQASKLLDEWVAAETEWKTLVSQFNGLTGDATISNVDAYLDTTVRFELFQYAVHYWEAKWLMECRELEGRGGADWAEYSKTGLRTVRPRWHRRMMITPCIVSTLHSLPGSMTYSTYGQNKFNIDYLVDEIDLLIVDEAGQTPPEVAGASFGLAKKALAIGDIKQIEPVRNLPKAVDIGNLQHYGVMTDVEEYESLIKTGGTVVDGSVMHIAQRTSRFHYLATAEPGMFLREHRRCFNEIISFCNELCYQGALLPMRGGGQGNGLFPPMAYIRVNGRASRPRFGSMHNQAEANSIAEWLSHHRQKIEQFYSTAELPAKLEDLVGVVTPFRAQQWAVERSCRQRGIKTGRDDGLMTVGTVHALQGAERRIVIFSTVYTQNNDGPFIDSSPSMLNVAVSRAKDSFIVFGDIDVLLNSAEGKPRKLLGKYLTTDPDNQLQSSS